MNKLFRSLSLGTAVVLGTMAFAQPIPPYDVTIMGIVAGCTPNAGNVVTVTTVQNTQPAVDIEVPLDANCGFTITLSMESFNGWFQVSTPCNGAIQSATLPYEVNSFFPDSTYLFVTLNCGGNVVDCEGVMGGSALPGTACDDGDPATTNDTWNIDCDCVGSAPDPCQACIVMEQATDGNDLVPFTVNFSNCSQGEMPMTHVWTLNDVNGPVISTQATTSYPFNEQGPFTVCLTTTCANGQSTVCDSVYFNAEGELFGSDTNLPCQAGFWVMQAYTYGDSINNPNGGGTEPIPNEVWVWNLSSGGTPPYTYLWSFGDGTSSVDPYPTHVYANGGPYQLCLTIADASGCTSTYCDDVSIDDNGIYTGLIVDGRPGMLRSGFTIRVISELPMAVAERNVVEEVSMWPNPVEDIIGLSFHSSRNANLILSIMDLNGRMIRSSNSAVNVGNNRHTISVADLEAGMYLLQISDGAQSTSRRFVKN